VFERAHRLLCYGSFDTAMAGLLILAEDGLSHIIASMSNFFKIHIDCGKN
jgi:hypothetical protein